MKPVSRQSDGRAPSTSAASGPTPLRHLIARLREADGPNRDLDFQIDTVVYAIDWRPHCQNARQVWGHGPGGRVLRHGRESCPAVTASVDAAHALLRQALPGWSWQIHTESRHEEGFRAAVWRSWGVSAYQRYVAQMYPTAAIAMVAAVLTALLDDPEAADTW
jgi:hypothetical protein